MAYYRAVTLLILLLQSSSIFAKSLLNNDVDLLLRLRKPELPSMRHRFSLDTIQNDNDTHFNTNAFSVKTKQILARADISNSTVPTFNETAFNQSASTACANAVNNYTAAINPSGLVACYNIAVWDNTTGVFQTDVRLYQKSAAIGSFEGLAPSDFSMSFSIPEATLSAPMMMTTNESVTADTPATGEFVLGFQNIGQMSKSLQFSKLTDSDLRALMIPSISLGATSPSGGTVDTSLASDTLSYVAGEFTQPDGTATNITTPEAITLSSPIIASASVFVLPGTHIKVYPVGLIITCIWAGLLFIAVGAGTIGRYQFRVNYRKRVQSSKITSSFI
ncbi:hypothetical protein UA08_03065 [Talaromyces atroroseus]|uniref:Uncharacterized protein n=1 Tax=Talaromyces atroroseus TaxID=1441469 RepID=A0A225AJP8_TALAT|nr:hypothetical protein UA08_03065 [Talaromyces atroroseus]OKL61732.1 hypothetical protein UA08_03065 [Talaromyces atroroseus]